MSNRLSIKLLVPTVAIAIIAIITVVFFGSDFSQASIISLLIVMTVIQAIAGYIYSQKKLTQRIERLQQYIDQVLSLIHI